MMMDMVKRKNDQLREKDDAIKKAIKELDLEDDFFEVFNIINAVEILENVLD